MNKYKLYKLIRYRKLVMNVLVTYLKYFTVRTFQNSRSFLRYVETHSLDDLRSRTGNEDMQPKYVLLRQINTALRHLRLDSNCLINSLVKRDILMKSGYLETIVVGIRKENEQIMAHAWLGCENASKYQETKRL